MTCHGRSADNALAAQPQGARGLYAADATPPEVMGRYALHMARGSDTGSHQYGLRDRFADLCWAL